MGRDWGDHREPPLYPYILLLLLHDYTLPTLSIMEIESCAPRLIYFFFRGRGSRGDPRGESEWYSRGMVKNLTITACRHCKRSTRLSCRGLCWGCYDRKDVRALYPLAGRSQDANRRTARELRNAGLRCKSCGCLKKSLYRTGQGVCCYRGGALAPIRSSGRPGSWEKIEDMAERAAMGLDLFHPGDAR